jgi:hypothetical protein
MRLTEGKAGSNPDRPGPIPKGGKYMEPIEEIKQDKRLVIQELGEDGGWAIAYLRGSKTPVRIIFSWGGGWDHVSVSYPERCCDWEEMCEVKDMFFRDDECAVQYHPPKSDYVNLHPYVLHLWRPQNERIPMPPKFMV